MARDASVNVCFIAADVVFVVAFEARDRCRSELMEEKKRGNWDKGYSSYLSFVSGILRLENVRQLFKQNAYRGIKPKRTISFSP